MSSVVEARAWSDCTHPSPILDAVADRMARLLDGAGVGLSITEIARQVDAPRGTVNSILRRPCERHGGRFMRAGLSNSRGRPSVLYRLATAPTESSLTVSR